MNHLKNPITIVGAGQLGGLIAHHLLEKGRHVKIIDSGSKLIRENRQIPWGWVRKISLQSELKKGLVENKFPIPEAKNKFYQNYGPMLISSKNNNSINAWQDWINKNPETNAQIFLPKQAEKEFELNSDYFNGNGGILMLDSRDYIMDFSKMNEYIWDYLDSHPNCKLIDNCKVEKINTNKENIATSIDTNRGKLGFDKMILCIGNQSQELIDHHIPKLNIRLPYAFIEPITTKNYIGLWNKDSSLTYFSNGNIKLACGTQSSFNPKQFLYKNKLNYHNLINFSKMGLDGLSNLNINTPNEILINKALEELKILGIEDKINFDEIKHCDIDLTPNLCPYMYFMPQANNILNISGFSGSGSIIIDSNFINLIIDSIENEKLNKKLIEFQPSKSIIKNLFPPQNKRTALSSIV
jgi:hypothetical protein